MHESAVLRPRASGAIVWLERPVCAASSRQADRRNTSDTVNPYSVSGASGSLRADIDRGKLLPTADLSVMIRFVPIWITSSAECLRLREFRKNFTQSLIAAQFPRE